MTPQEALIAVAALLVDETPLDVEYPLHVSAGPLALKDGKVRITGTIVRARSEPNVEPPPQPKPEPTPTPAPEPQPEPEPEPVVRDLHLWVRGADGKGIPNARVTIGGEMRTTSGEGHVHFPVNADLVTVHVEADGYHPLSTTVVPGEHPITLERVPVPQIPKPQREGAVRLDRRVLTDSAGPFLGLGCSFFWASRAFRDYRDRYERNMAYLARHRFTYYRNFVLTGGWPDPDPWRDAGAFLPWALEVLPHVLDDAWSRFKLRSSLTIFDGFVQTWSFAEQQHLVRRVCEILAPRRRVLNDLQIANEYGPCEWDFPEGIEWLRAHARLARQLLGPDVVLSISSTSAAMNDADEKTAVAEARTMFGGLLDGVVNVSVNHDSRETRTIDGPWRHVRQGWDRVLHDPKTGQALWPDASIDDEPMGPRSSVAEETNVSRLVAKAMTDYIAGRCAYTFHPDAGIWSNLLHFHRQGGKGEFVHIDDHEASEPFAAAMDKLLAILPADLPNWSRTRHGLPGHPFGNSFRRQDEVYTQIWPDKVTAHGVVRAYCAFSGNNFVCLLSGIRDRIDLSWSDPIEATLYACGTGDEVARIGHDDTRARTVPESLDTDVLVIGKYV